MKRKWMVTGLLLFTGLFLASNGFALTLVHDLHKGKRLKIQNNATNVFSLSTAAALEGKISAVKSAYIEVAGGFNKKSKGTERWKVKVGDQVFKLDRTKKMVLTQAFDITDVVQQGGPIEISFFDGKAAKRLNGMKLDSLQLVVNYQDSNGNGAAAPVPEPGTMALLGVGLVAMGGAVRKKFRA